MASLVVEILTPEGPLWRGEASALMARSTVGKFTVLAQHTATVGDLVASVVRVEVPEGPVTFAVHSGFFEVASGPEVGETRATILASVAELTSDIDVARAQAAKERYEAEMAESRDDDGARYALAAHGVARAELRLAAATRRGALA